MEFKMGDRCIHEKWGECYFVCSTKTLSFNYIVECTGGWERDPDIPSDYVSKKRNKYKHVKMGDLSLLEKKKYEYNEDRYEDWIKGLAILEARRQQRKIDTDILSYYDSNVFCQFSWIRSEQGHVFWSDIHKIGKEYIGDYNQGFLESFYIEWKDKRTTEKVDKYLRDHPNSEPKVEQEKEATVKEYLGEYMSELCWRIKTNKVDETATDTGEIALPISEPVTKIECPTPKRRPNNPYIYID